ncbi:voltage-dependent calcium channel subunit alpha-2/delta-2 isoform X1 [Arapaima gigas]
MALCAPSRSLLLAVCVHSLLLFSASSPGTRALSFPQHYTMMHWAGRIEKEIDKVLQHVSGVQQMRGVSIPIHHVLCQQFQFSFK